MSNSIFLDVDQTLVYTRGWEFSPCVVAALDRGERLQKLGRLSAEGLQKEVAGPLDKVVISPKGAMYISRLRPHALQFLKDIESLGTLFAMSAGSGPFQKKVLEAHGLLRFFSQVIGREDTHVFFSNPSILIDDNEEDDPEAIAKKSALRDLRLYHRIPAFCGEEDDEGLVGLVEKIRLAKPFSK